MKSLYLMVLGAYLLLGCGAGETTAPKLSDEQLQSKQPLDPKDQKPAPLVTSQEGADPGETQSGDQQSAESRRAPRRDVPPLPGG